ncbi:MAG: transporter substrate-binding domain-containing protein [Magnetococcales bacterium]|nr:transporter substrate-binding domain-containing protein [Magnetococcales bacterium]
MKLPWLGRTLLWFCLIFPPIIAIIPPVCGAERKVTVGVYQNEPSVYADQDGAIKGFYIDLLEHTAAREGWQLVYVLDSWENIFRKLLIGELDLLVGIAYTQERAEKVDFTQESAFSNWGQAYLWNPDLDAIPKLKNRIVAGLQDDIYFLRFRAMLDQFGIKHQSMAMPDYESVLQTVARNDADVGIIPRSTGTLLDKRYDVYKSSIVCCPMEIRFAVPRQRNADLLRALDRDLREMKGDNESYYYQAFNTWFEGGAKKPLPSWVKPLLGGTVVMVALLFVVNLLLRNRVRARTRELEKEIGVRERAEVAMRAAMRNLLTLEVTPGVYWVQVPEVGLYILCGCPGEVVKHLMHRGHIGMTSRDGVAFETGPNAILLSDLLVQNGGFSNLAEFPVLQMLYRQGTILPNHPNNTGRKPLLIGSPEQVRAQLAYIHRGNYGLLTREEIMACGVDPATAGILMNIKLKFAFGAIQAPESFLDTCMVEWEEVEIRDGVTVARTGSNRYCFRFKGESTEVDLNLPAGVGYEPPYPLGRHQLGQHRFAVVHTGEGDGWDVNRPSMGSIILFHGRIFLIDASPGILQSLTALGVDISEVEGIFHTHAHDDHFAGLPALIQTDRRLRYCATPLVRASVTKKFAALMSLDENHFANLFQIQDLVEDAWNDCGGLEVRPILSPHPLETTMFLFRARDDDGVEHTYAHWADLSSNKVLDGMVGDGPNDVPAAFVARVKQNYLLPADLKKLDIGGGLIHGVAEDFRHDPSKRLILAHYARHLTTGEMEIGSETSFGAEDVLIPGQRDYRLERAADFLRAFLPTTDEEELLALLNHPVVHYNAGTIILKGEKSADTLADVGMILSGTVAYLNASAKMFNHLAFGSLIGCETLFGEHPERNMDTPARSPEAWQGECRRQWTYRTVSHCAIIRIPVSAFQGFLERNGLLADMSALMGKISFLRKTWLFGEHTTMLTLSHIARNMERLRFQHAGDLTPHVEGGTLWLVEQGELHLLDARGRKTETIRPGGFFGEESLLEPSAPANRVRTEGKVVVHRIRWEGLLQIPIVHWKLLEVHAKRRTARLS